MWLLANWKIIAYGATVMAIFGSGYYVSSQIAETRQEKALAAQELKLQAACAADKKLTENSSHAYQTKVSALTRQLADAKRMFAAKCIMPVTGEARSSDGSARAGEYAGQNAVNAGTLIDYAGECETYRLQVISLQDFINDTWKTH